MTEICSVAEATDEVRLLVSELNEELGALYPPEQRHGLALDALFLPHIRFFLALEDKIAIGCGGIALMGDFAEVKRMYVRPNHRGQGAADAIMTRLIAETRNAGLSVVRLEAGTRSFAAHSFYLRHGFRACSAFEPYTSLPPHHIAGSVFLEKPLS
jgi:putative acetyltransferase